MFIGYLGKFHQDLTSFSWALEIRVNFREMIPIHGRKIQVGELTIIYPDIYIYIITIYSKRSYSAKVPIPRFTQYVPLIASVEKQWVVNSGA